MFSDFNSMVPEAGLWPPGSEARSYIYCLSWARAVPFHALREDLTVFQLFILRKKKTWPLRKRKIRSCIITRG